MRNLALLEVAFCAVVTACGQPPPQRCMLTRPQVLTQLTADGTVFRDYLGRVVFLRGVDAGGRSKFAPYVPFDYGSDFDGALAKYMDRAQSWGIDVIRLPFTWAALEPTQGTFDDAWLAHYDAIIDAAWARGIWTVIDFHQDVYSENYCGDGFPSWTLTSPPAPHHDCPQWQFEYFSDDGVKAAFDAFWAPGSTVQTAYLAAWDAMLARYTNHDGVLGFEPMNEPGWGSADEPTFAATTLSAFYTSVVAHFRSIAPKSLVFIDPPGLDGVAQTTTLTRPAGDGIVFAPHFYPLSNNPDTALDTMTRWQTTGAAWNTPTFIGEFGASHDLATTLPFMQAVFGTLDTLGLSGTEWEYSVAAESWNSEADGLVAADGTEYDVAKAVIRPYAREVAGTSIATAFDPSTNLFTLSFTPTTNDITVISVPKRAYPSGARLDLEGACFDDTEPGFILLRPDPDATTVTLAVGPM